MYVWTSLSRSASIQVDRAKCSGSATSSSVTGASSTGGTWVIWKTTWAVRAPTRILASELGASQHSATAGCASRPVVIVAASR